MDGTRQVLGKRRLNRLVDVRMLLADLARKMEREIMGERDSMGRIIQPAPPLPEAERLMAYLKVIDTLGKYVEKREIEALEARVKALRAERDARAAGVPALASVPPAS